MLSLSELVRIYVCLAPTDMRKSFDSLAALVREWLGYDPLVRPPVRVPQSPRRSGETVVVGPRRADAVLPAAGTRNLSLPDRRNDPQARSIEVSAQELSLVLWGIDPASVKRQQRYQRTA